MECPKAALFDLDDTLARSFESPSAEMKDRLISLIALRPVAILTGRDFAWMSVDFLSSVAPHVQGNFFVLPESAAQCLSWDGTSWQTRYEHSLADHERSHIHDTIDAAVTETGALEGLPRFGQQFVDRKATVSFSCTGWKVPNELRYTWDPGNARRTKLRDAIAAKLPAYDVLMGGATTIDVNKRGINKAFGIRWLSERLHIPAHEMLYVGDALFPGGNDHVVIVTGVRTRQTSGPEETEVIIDELLTACSRS